MRQEKENSPVNAVLISLLQPNHISGSYCYNRHTCKIWSKIRGRGRAGIKRLLQGDKWKEFVPEKTNNFGK